MASIAVRQSAAPPLTFDERPPTTPGWGVGEGSMVPPPSAGDGKLPGWSVPGAEGPMIPNPSQPWPMMGGTGGTGGYWNDPMLQQYTDFATDAMKRLMEPVEPNSVMAQAISHLNGVFGAGQAGYDQFKAIAENRLGQLKNPLFSTGGPTDTPEAMKNSALLNTRYVEPMVQARDAAQKQALERASARGLGLTSGLTEDMARNVDNQFTRNLSQGYRELMLEEVKQNEARQQEAVNIGQLLAQLAVNPSAVSAAGQLGNIGQGLQNQSLSQLMNAAGLSQNLAQLPMQNLMSVASLMNSLGNQPLPHADPTTGLIQMLLGMTNQGETVRMNAQNQGDNFWGSLMNQLPGLLPGLSRMFNPGGYIGNDVAGVEKGIYG